VVLYRIQAWYFPISYHCFKILWVTPAIVVNPFYPWLLIDSPEYFFTTILACVGLLLTSSQILVYLFLFLKRNQRSLPGIDYLIGSIYKCLQYQYWWVPVILHFRKKFFLLILLFYPADYEGKFDTSPLRNIGPYLLLLNIIFIAVVLPYKSKIYRIQWPFKATIEFSIGNILDIVISARLLSQLVGSYYILYVSHWYAAASDFFIIGIIFIAYTVELTKKYSKVTSGDKLAVIQ